MPRKKYNDNKRLPRDQYDPVKIFNTANSFYSAAERCNEMRYKNENVFEWLPIPSAVNMALACELYMKAIIVSEKNTFGNMHNLDDLYQTLSGNTQATIQKELKYDKSGFHSALERVADLFVEGRYIHEYESMIIHIEFLQKFTNILKEIAYEQITHS